MAIVGPIAGGGNDPMMRILGLEFMGEVGYIPPSGRMEKIAQRVDAWFYTNRALGLTLWTELMGKAEKIE
jgi:hypothetical protein